MKTWRGVFRRRACTGLVAMSVIAPMTFALIQGGLASLLVPTWRVLGIHSGTGAEAVVLAFSFAGALLAATLLAFSNALLARQGSFLLGLLLGVITVVTLAAFRSWPQEASASARMAMEYGTFVIASATASHIAGRNHPTAGG